MASIDALIESAVGGSAEDTRALYQAFAAQFATLNSVTGQNFPTGRGQTGSPVSAKAGQLSVTAANGVYTVGVKNAAGQQTVINEVSYSAIKGFSSGVTILPQSTSSSYTVQSPGTQLFFRCRWSLDGINWSPYVLASTTAAAAGLISSAAQDNNTVLNQTNRGFIDSQAAGASANVRIFGSSGPYTGYNYIKGGLESPLPSATIINVAYASTQYVAYDGEQYTLSNELPGAFPDTSLPVGKVSVTGTGTPTLPTVTLFVQSGHVIGATITNAGAGLTQVPTFTITDPTGTGASIIATGISAGAITGIQVTNSGANYSATPTATASGGVFSGATGGGTAVGANSGRMTNV